jgi:hypothetical protein
MFLIIILKIFFIESEIVAVIININNIFHLMVYFIADHVTFYCYDANKTDIKV